MADDTVENPFDLFLRLRQRFSEIELVPQQFGNPLRDYQHVMFFYPRFVASGGECIHPTYYRGDGDNGRFLEFDVKEGKLDFDFRYKSGSEVPIDKQFDAAAGAAILAGPLKPRFAIGILRLDIVRKCLLDLKPEHIPVQVSWEGGRHIPGLRQPKSLLAISWRFFFPDKSKERDAMEFSLEYWAAKKDLENKDFDDMRAQSEESRDRALQTYKIALGRIAA